MKKALIAIISVIYAVAIIIVAFLGTKNDISNRTVYAEEVLLLNEDIFYEGLPKVEGNLIIDVYKRPDESVIDKVTGIGPATSTSGAKTRNINWNFEFDETTGDFNIKRDYAIFITDSNFFFDKMGKVLTLKAQVKPDDTTKKDLSYYIEAPQKVKESLSISNNGEIAFTKAFTSSNWTDFDAFVQTTDGSLVEMDVLVKVHKYEQQKSIHNQKKTTSC